MSGRGAARTSDHGFRVLENEWIELGDGTRLAARIWLPDLTYDQPVPAILEYLPYKKRGGTDQRDDVTFPEFARCGYAGVRVDIRGNGESDGLMEDEYTVQELSDGAEVIAWIARQPWCDGNVGMIGISWGGFNGLQVAALRPPALKAIVTVCSTDDRYADDIHYMGGCPLTDNLTWSQQMLAYSSRPPDPELMGESWRERWMERLEALPFLAAAWLRHQRRDAFWKHGSVCEDFDAIEVPVLAVGGWHDAYTNAVPRLLSGLGSRAKGVIGPWEHRYPNIAQVGPAIDFLGECVRWWDRWLKGEGVDDEPALRAYLMKSAPPNSRNGDRRGLWVAEASWPSATFSPRTFYLHRGVLADDPPDREGIEISTPVDLGIMSGSFCAGMRIDDELPGDQRQDDEKSVLFDSAPLDEGLAILGAPEFEFEFKSDKPHAMIVARLCDVAPDGASVRVAYAPFNLTHLTSHETPMALEPGKTYTARFALSDAGYVFAKGNRIRLALSTSYWPTVWPSPATPVVELVTGASRLTVPVRGEGERIDIQFDPAPESVHSTHEVLSEPTCRREISFEPDGMVVLDLSDDMGHTRDAENGLEIASTVRQRYWIRPDDPLSAKVEAAWTWETRRGDWHVNTRSSTTMTSDARTFYLTARLEAFEGGAPVFDRTWQETVERDHV